MSNDEVEVSDKGLCRVCQSPAAGLYFGALVCLPCKSFYIRCTKDGVKLRCQQDITACTINKGRFKCQYCRFEACLAAGMQRKEEKPEVVQAPEGSSLCKVCGDLANGVHFGVTSCEGCKKFFRRGLTEFQNYSCKEGGDCPINPRTRNQCRYCRYMACINAGMSREAIKVGRPPSKKENSRHHPYGQINLSTSHHDTSPKLYSNGHFLKQETPWIPNGNHSVSSLPAIIHGANARRYPITANKKPADRQISADLNSSCTSNEINEMLLQYLDPNSEMPPLPAHFDFDEAFAQIDSPNEPIVNEQKPSRLQRIENLPRHQQMYQQYPQLAQNNHGKASEYPIHQVKVESSNAYREPVHMYSHPSPPYDINYETSMYQPYNTTSVQQPSSTVYHQSSANQNSPLYTSANHITGINRSSNKYDTNPQGSPITQNAYEMSPSNPMAFDPLSTHIGNGDSNPYQMHNQQQVLNQTNQSYNDIRHQRHSCEVIAKQQDLSNPYSQPEMSPDNFSSCASSPQSSCNGTSGYATDSQDFLDEFSIYDPVDIRQVNHKYMPSCVYEPLTFNEQALTVEDIWSKNEHSSENPDSNSDKNAEDNDGGSGMFKRMKSIDDKVKQGYWFDHDMPEVEYTDTCKKEMKYLMEGWIKCKEYIRSSIRTSSTSEEGKESRWPNVKENAPLQLKMWEFIKTRLLRGTTAQVMFYQQIRGSDKVPEKDQKTLVSTASFSNCLLINILYWWDEEREQCKYFWSWKIPSTDPFYVFRQTLLKFSRAIRDLNFDEVEIMLACALTLFSADIIQIEKKDVIAKEREPLVKLCAAYMKDKYKDKYKTRFGDMLTMVPALRYLSIWHHDLMAYAKTFGSVGLNLDKMKISES